MVFYFPMPSASGEIAETASGHYKAKIMSSEMSSTRRSARCMWRCVAVHLYALQSITDVSASSLINQIPRWYVMF